MTRSDAQSKQKGGLEARLSDTKEVGARRDLL